jgi:glycerol-3-phosphate dehydrogenase
MSSSNLAWGGIKYMETLELGLVRKLCRSRNELMRATRRRCPRLASCDAHARLRGTVAGATCSCGSARGSTGHRRLLHAAPAALVNADIAREEPVATDEAVGGIEYSDAYLHDNDARFVWGFVRDATTRGAVVVNYAESEGSSRDGERWAIVWSTRVGGRDAHGALAVLVNACGPFVEQHNERSGHPHAPPPPVLEGHPPHRTRRHAAERVLAFFADDGRLFFAIPMGPLEHRHHRHPRGRDAGDVVTDEDREFVLANINKRLRLPRPLASDVIAERCGVRPLAVSTAGDDGRDRLD